MDSFCCLRSSDPRGRACRAPADTDAPCSNIPAGLHTALPVPRAGGGRPTGCLAGAAPTLPGRFPYVRPSAAVVAVRTTSTVGLASGPPGGRRAASTLDRATRTVCHMGQGRRQSSRRAYPGSDEGQTQGRSISPPARGPRLENPLQLCVEGPAAGLSKPGASGAVGPQHSGQEPGRARARDLVG